MPINRPWGGFDVALGGFLISALSFQHFSFCPTVALGWLWVACAVCFLLSLRRGFARPFDLERWRLDVGCTGPSNPRLRSATLIQPAPSFLAPAAFCPRRRGHASGSPVIPRRVPEVDHEIPFICRALPLLFGFLAVCRGRGNQKSSAGAPCRWQTRSLMSISSATSSSNPSQTSNGCATGWRRGKERRENGVSADLCTAIVEIDRRLRGNPTEDLLTETLRTER